MKKFKFEYKWVIVIISFLMIFTCLGFCSSNASLYTYAITDALDISRSSYSLAKTLRFIMTSIVNMFFGFFVARFGPKKLIITGILSLIGAMILNSIATNVWLFYIGGCLLGIGFSFAGTTMISSVINRWFDKNKGTVMGIVLSANGLGGALAAQIVTPIIYDKNNVFGFRNAYKMIAVFLAVLIFLVLFFFKEEPKDYDGDRTVKRHRKSRGKDWVGIDFSKLKRMPIFYITLICIFLTGFVLHAIGDAAGVHMKDVGLSDAYIATVLSAHSLVLTASKFLTGFIYDKRGIRTAFLICAMSSIVSITSVAFTAKSTTGMVLAMIYGIFSSVALPLETIMLPIYVSDLFGQKSFDKVLGIIVSINTAGYAVAAPLINLVYDILHTYTPALILCSLIMLGIVITMMFVISKGDKIRKKVIEEYENSIKESEAKV